MDPIVTSLFGTVARHLAGMFGAGDRYDLRLLPDAARLIGGMPAAFTNWVLIDVGPVSADRVRELTAEVTERDLPGILVVAEAAVGDVAPVVKDLGFVVLETAPWMVYRPEQTYPAVDGYRVERVTTDAQLQAAYELMADAFAPYDCTVEVWNNAFGAHVYDPSIANLFVAYRADEPYSAVTTTGTGETVGIWSMATPTSKQRQGAGRAALTQAMAWHQSRGATTFYLMATEEGIHLYKQSGFRTVTETPIWLIGVADGAVH